MLSEREMAMAKELAHKLIEVNRLKEKERFENAFKAIKSMFEGVKENITEIWDSIKENSINISDSIKGIGNQKQLRNYWHVPIKMNIPQAPFVKNHNLQFARSNL